MRWARGRFARWSPGSAEAERFADALETGAADTLPAPMRELCASAVEIAGALGWETLSTDDRRRLEERILVLATAARLRRARRAAIRRVVAVGAGALGAAGLVVVGVGRRHRAHPVAS